MKVGLSPGRVDKAEDTLREAVKTLDQVINQVSSGKSASDYSHAIWETYSKAEYSIMMLKLHLAVETPGRLAGKNKTTDTDIDTLKKASDELSAALTYTAGGDYSKALESARRGRDMLRETLLLIRKVKV
ncbi:MAG: hypothetical protein HYY22_01855 [Thaumarchaeota archaeon]|nr:hypothetical protein [Nitrososphaerota archaeon]